MNRVLYRILILVSFVSLMAYALIVKFPPAYSKYMATARLWNHLEAVGNVTVLSIVAIVVDVSIVVGLFGLFIFRPFGRWLIMGPYTLAIFWIPFFGLSVLTPTEKFLATLGTFSAVIAVMLSLIPPISNHFKPRPPAHS